MPAVTYSTRNVAPAQRAAHWNAVIEETYFPLHLTFRDAAAFQGRLESRKLGEVSLSRLVTMPVQYERHLRHIAGTSEEEYLITFPCQSPIEFRQLGRDVRCEPGGFILERRDEPYRFSYGEANDLCVLKVAKPVLAERLRDPDRFCARAFNGRDGLGGLFTAMARRALADSPDDALAGDVLGRQLIELLALAIDRQCDAGDGARSAVRAAHLRRAEDFIRHNLSDVALSPDLVAESCGISKRYLHELFAGANGTVSRYIRQQRLIAARDLLQMPGATSISDIAYRFGFSDQAQFSRLFKASFGTTPSAFRASQANRN